jgi:hypothetical protein
MGELSEFLFHCFAFVFMSLQVLCALLKFTVMSAESPCSSSLCCSVTETFVYAFSPQTNWVSIRTDTSHWPMKWTLPSQNWLVINSIPNTTQQVNWTRVTSQEGLSGRLFTFTRFGFRFLRLFPSEDIIYNFYFNDFFQ